MIATKLAELTSSALARAGMATSSIVVSAATMLAAALPTLASPMSASILPSGLQQQQQQLTYGQPSNLMVDGETGSGGIEPNGFNTATSLSSGLISSNNGGADEDGGLLKFASNNIINNNDNFGDNHKHCVTDNNPSTSSLPALLARSLVSGALGAQSGADPTRDLQQQLAISTVTTTTTATATTTYATEAAHDNSINHYFNNDLIVGGSNAIATSTTTMSTKVPSTIDALRYAAAEALSLNENREQSFSEWWSEYWSRQPFPSGYTQSSITLLACFLTTIMFLIVVGNLLVCIAIFTEKSLKPTQNWFIASLAVSDMLLGLVVMPFSLARELMGFWMFGQLWCDIHEAIDVLLTTASINTLCLISLDRYWSITQAVKYLKKRTPRRGAFMIAFVWILSAAVSLPPLFGWKKQSPNVSAVSSQATNNSLVSIGGMPSPSSDTIDDIGSDINPTQAPDMNDDRRPEVEMPASDGTREGIERRARRDAHLSSGSRQVSRNQAIYGRRLANETKSLARSRLATPILGGRQEEEAASHLFALQPQSEPQLEQLSQYQDFINGQSVTLRRLLPRATMQLSGELPTGSAPSDLQQQQTQMQSRQDQASIADYPSCQLSDDIGYVLYSAFGSFFIPCAVMVFTYIKIFLAARSRARRAINKQAARAQGAGAAPANVAGAAAAGSGRMSARGQRASAAIEGLRAHGTSPNDKTSADTSGGQLASSISATITTAAPVAGAGSGNWPNVGVVETHTPTPTPMMKGKIVIVERRKLMAASPLAAGASSGLSVSPGSKEAEAVSTGSQHALVNTATYTCAELVKLGGATSGVSGSATLSLGGPAGSSETPGDCTLTTSGVHRASADALCGGGGAPGRPPGKGGEAARQPDEAGARRAAALLKAIGEVGVGGVGGQEALLLEELASATPTCRGDQKAGDGGSKEGGVPGAEVAVEVGPGVNAETEASLSVAAGATTNDTCFMTIEEDSDMYDAQAGRTIVMVSEGNAAGRHLRQRASSLAATTPSSVMMTMMPMMVGGAGAGPRRTHERMCTNAACKRRLRRAHRRRRSGASYSGGSSVSEGACEPYEGDEASASAACNADDPRTDDEPSHTYEHEDDSRDDSHEDEDDDDDDEDDEDLLTDECNGYSLSNCALDLDSPQRCGPQSCPSCRECARERSGHFRHRRRRHRDQPQTGSASRSPSSKRQGRVFNRRGGRRNDDDDDEDDDDDDVDDDDEAFAGHDDDEDDEDDEAAASVDDQLSLTEYPSNEDECSSIVGHDVLDATEPLGGDRKSRRKSTVDSHSPDGATQPAGSGRKKSSIGFSLGRLGTGNQGLVALAASQQQRQQQYNQQQQQIQLQLQQPQQPQATSGTRNLKALRQNFFLKLNQLTAKSAQRSSNKAKNSPLGKSSAQSSGTSYEPSVDCATTSNVHSLEYPPETTIADVDDLEARTTSGESSGIKQRNQQVHGQLDDESKLHQHRLRAQDQRSSARGQDVISGLSGNDDTYDDDKQTGPNEVVGDGSKGVLQLRGQPQVNTSNSLINRKSPSDNRVPSQIGKQIRASPDERPQAERKRAPGSTALSIRGVAGAKSGNLGANRAYLASDNERHKRKQAKARERRATLILGLIMGAFVCSWMPFFTFYVLRALCVPCRDYISPRFEAFIFWMGYCNSAINPIIYTIFNRDFRKAFRKILFKCL